MSFLSKEEYARISRAVKKAEKSTGGEIVTAIIPESDNYADRELLAGIAAGILTFIILSFQGSVLEGWLDSHFWLDSTVLLSLCIGFCSLVVGTLIYLLAQIPFLDRVIIGRRRMEVAVRNRAMRHFVESAAYDTVDRTGVLLFISVLERRVELIADKGINDAVAADTWDRIVSALVRGIKDGKIAEALEAAVGDIGAALAEHVPPRPDDENELADGPVELPRGS